MNSMNVSSQMRFVDEEVGRRAEAHPLIQALRYDGSTTASMPRPEMTDKGRSSRMHGAVVHPAAPSRASISNHDSIPVMYAAACARCAKHPGASPQLERPL
jgi:hypothetical protein